MFKDNHAIADVEEIELPDVPDGADDVTASIEAHTLAELEAFLSKGSSVAAAQDEFPMIPRMTIKRLARQFRTDRRAAGYRVADAVPSSPSAPNEPNTSSPSDHRAKERERRESLKDRVDAILAPINRELARRRAAERQRIDAIELQPSSAVWSSGQSYADQQRLRRQRDVDDKLRLELEQRERDVRPFSTF